MTNKELGAMMEQMMQMMATMTQVVAQNQPTTKAQVKTQKEPENKALYTYEDRAGKITVYEDMTIDIKAAFIWNQNMTDAEKKERRIKNYNILVGACKVAGAEWTGVGTENLALRFFSTAQVKRFISNMMWMQEQKEANKRAQGE